MGRTSGGSGGGGGPPYQSGAGEPTTKTPASIGQLYIDTTNSGVYVGYATASGKWLQLGGYAPSGAWTGVDAILDAGAPAAAWLVGDTSDVLSIGSSQFEATVGGSVYINAISDLLVWGVPEDTSGIATFSTPSVSSGVAFTPNANADVELTWQITHAGTMKMTMGPTTGAENTIFNTVTVILDQTFTKHIPAGWLVVLTYASSATGGSYLAQVV